jgi:streptogramin lyase
MEYNNKLYLSCDYGISVFDLTTFEFDDTYYIGTGGTQSAVYQTTVKNDELYAAVAGSGIKKVSLSNPNIIDFNQWQTISSGSWIGITTLQNQLVATNTDKKVYQYNGTTFSPFATFSSTIINLHATADYVLVTTATEVKVFSSTWQTVLQVYNSQITPYVTFTCATVKNNILYIGTNEQGVLTLPFSSPTNYDFLLPNGPLMNKIFRVKKSSSAIWAIYGGYDIYYNPYNPGLMEYPISKFSASNGWTFIPYANLLGAKTFAGFAFSPQNDKNFYVSSYFSGLLKFENEQATTLYNTTNTGTDGLQSLTLTPPNPSYIDIRVNGPVFDKNGNLWMTNNMVTKPLKVLKSNGQWQSYDFTSAESAQDLKDTSYGPFVIDKNGTKWLTQDRNGVVGFNENYNNKIIAIKTGTSGNLPNNDVRCVAVDTKNQLWIGTISGLRIVPSVDSFITDTDIQSKAIIILENDLAQELFYDQFIIDIAVDGANRKWVAIAQSGVYLVSSNGQETIYHFTKENSPLPDNNVNDIEIDPVTGEVFFATDKGLVSFKGMATQASGDLTNVYVYPNPVRPEYEGTVKISNLTNKAVVKITDVEGNLVYETTSEGGTIEWDTTAFGQYKVATGVYVILISGQDGVETTVKKVMIVR